MKVRQEPGDMTYRLILRLQAQVSSRPTATNANIYNIVRFVNNNISKRQELPEITVDIKKGGVAINGIFGLKFSLK